RGPSLRRYAILALRQTEELMATASGHDVPTPLLGRRPTGGGRSGLLVLSLIVATLTAGCGTPRFSAAWDPYAAAPPAPGGPWLASDGKRQPRLSTLIERLSADVDIDTDKVHGLADLIDLSQRHNPETRRAWEEARAAAARLGRAESTWFPTLAAMAAAGTSRVVEKAGVNGGGAVPVVGPELTPSLQLSWLLLDFGRRSAAVEEAGWEVMAANLHF